MAETNIDVSGEMEMPSRPSAGENKAGIDLQKITSPVTLLVIAAVAYGCHKIRTVNKNVCVVGCELTPQQQMLALNLGAAPLLLLAGAGAVLFWTLGASCFVIFMHSVFYNIDAIVTEESDSFYV